MTGKTTKQELSDLKSFIENHVMSKLRWHDKLIYAVLTMLLLILGVVVSAVMTRSFLP